MNITTYKEYRHVAQQQISKVDYPSFRYGLNIIIAPPRDFQINETVSHCTFKIKQPDGTEVIQTSEWKHMQQFLDTKWSKEDKLFYFHQALVPDICCVHITKSGNSEIIVESLGKTNVVSFFIIVEPSVHTKIIIKKQGNPLFFSEDVRVIAGENSSIEIVTVNLLGQETQSVHFRQAYHAPGARVEWVEVSVGSLYNKTEVISHLSGEGSSVNNSAFFLGDQNQRYDLYTASLHEASNTQSNILTKGVVQGKAKILSRGLVQIGKTAHSSSGYEQQDTLILTETAEADAIPNLEIYNHNVKCSHGSTIGRIDPEKLFYLMSRGLTEQQAINKIIEGYFSPALTHLNESTRTEIERVLFHE